MKPPSFLIDTDWIIDHFNGIARISRRIEEAHKEGLAVSVISLAEVWDGVFLSEKPLEDEEQLRVFLGSVTILGVSPGTAERFGRLRGILRKQGRMIPDFDLLIAATALQHNLTLLSNNRRHFEQVEGLHLESVPG